MSSTTSSTTSYRVNKHIHCLVKAVDRGRREIQFLASHQKVDRDGDVVVTTGISTDSYKRNPVLLLQHDRTVRFGRTDSLTLQRIDGE